MQYLAHHGIEGQKWGQTNGPPYPLSYSKYSKEEKKSLTIKDKKSIIKTNSKYAKRKNGQLRQHYSKQADQLSDKQMDQKLQEAGIKYEFRDEDENPNFEAPYRTKVYTVTDKTSYDKAVAYQKKAVTMGKTYFDNLENNYAKTIVSRAGVSNTNVGIAWMKKHTLGFAPGYAIDVEYSDAKNGKYYYSDSLFEKERVTDYSKTLFATKSTKWRKSK